MAFDAGPIGVTLATAASHGATRTHRPGHSPERVVFVVDTGHLPVAVAFFEVDDGESRGAASLFHEYGTAGYTGDRALQSSQAGPRSPGRA